MQPAASLSTSSEVHLWSEALGTSSGCRSISNAEVLFREGDEASGFYEVLSGTLRGYKIFADGSRQIISFSYPGDIVGFGHGEAFRFDCDAIADTKVRFIPKNSLLKAIKEQPELGERLLTMASDELAHTQDLSILLCRKSAAERIASFLLNIATRSNWRPGVALALPMCRQDIADHLGLTIETVSRTITKMRARRVIDIPTRSSFVVNDMAALRHAAQAEDTVH